MRKCGKCRNPGHDRRSCKKMMRRKNPPATLNDIITISIKQTPIQKETPYSTRPRCRSCGDLAAALIAKLKNGQMQPLKWSDRCLACIGDSLLDSELEYYSNPRIRRLSSEEPHRKRFVTRSKCKVCGAETKDKDYCIDHIQDAPYTRRLAQKMSEMEQEETAVTKYGVEAVKPTSYIVKDIIKELETHGKLTTGSLAKELDLSKEVIESYIRFMERSNLIKITHTPRGNMVVELI